MQRVVAMLVVLVAFARGADAHQTSVKYVGLIVDGTHVAVTFRVAPGDVTDALGLAADARPTAVDAAAAPAVASDVAHWLAIGSRDRACAASAPAATADPDGKFVVVTWTASCDTTEELHLDFAAFFAIDKRHIAIIRLEGADDQQHAVEPTDAIVRIGESPLVMRLGGPPITSLLAWIREGMHHIYSGRDHISFVLALLLVVMLERKSRDGANQRTLESGARDGANQRTLESGARDGANQRTLESGARDGANQRTLESGARDGANQRTLESGARDGANQRTLESGARDGANQRTLESGVDWQLRGRVATARSTAAVITAFTIGHSISLIAAALGWVDLPSRLVESLIALSIAYTAVENIVNPEVRWRFLLTFGFGLVHGLGFASQLAQILPPTSTVVPLLCFNVGVEVGQLSIVLVALPVFYVVARTLGADHYRRIGMPVVSGFLCVAGMIWFLERVFQVTLLGM